jgi:hypothetical protein
MKKMNRARRLFPALAAVLSLAFVVNSQTAMAKPTHHDAKQLVGANRKVDGHHDIDHHGKFTTSVEMRANRKMALSKTGHLVYASLLSGQMEDMGTVYIGYSYIDDNGDEQIYWFPAEMIEDPYTGAVEYVPTS